VKIHVNILYVKMSRYGVKRLIIHNIHIILQLIYILWRSPKISVHANISSIPTLRVRGEFKEIGQPPLYTTSDRRE
jgi:hypothetical protein